MPEHTEVRMEKEIVELGCLAERKGSRIWLTNELRHLPEALSVMKCYHSSICIASKRFHSRILVNKTLLKNLQLPNCFVIKPPVYLVKKTPFCV